MYWYLVYGLACHEFLIVQWLEHLTGVRKVIGLNSVVDAFFLCPMLRHIISHFFTELKIYHLFYISHSWGLSHSWSLQYAGRVSYMNLVYGPAGHGSFEAQSLEHPTGGQGFSPVGDSDFFFVPCSWHVEHIISHFFTEPRIYHLKFLYISHSSQYAGRVSYMYLV